VRTVAAGQSLLDPAVTRRVIDEFTRRDGRDPIAPERLEVLTDRERAATWQVSSGPAGTTGDEIVSRRPSESLRVVDRGE
jgi:hypothetical protein